MGRLGPLTSQALGRSPYDDVVEGTGEVDPHEPPKQYDDKGRLINPRAKDAMKDVIRAHNEVMHVIGVAEPEGHNNIQEATDPRIPWLIDEADKSDLLRAWASGIVISSGTFGIDGVRRRIMIYRHYTRLPFSKLFDAERDTHSGWGLVSQGVPSLLAIHALGWCENKAEDRPWFCTFLSYFEFHFRVFHRLQQLDLISSAQWLPEALFFLPFSAASPFSRPPPLASLTPRTLVSWLGMNAGPIAVVVIYRALQMQIIDSCVDRIWQHLPGPLDPSLRKMVPDSSPGDSEPPAQTMPDSPTLGPEDAEIRHGQAPPAVDVPTLMALDGQPNDEAIPVERLRRQSTFSSRGGEDYGTDDEDAEMVNQTLISFDVDTTESVEPPAGVWSAELRPSFSGETRVAKESPRYCITLLTIFPSQFAAQILASAAAQVLLIPYESLALRVLARGFAQKRGLPLSLFLTPNLLDGLTPQWLLNMFGVEVLRLIATGEIWALASYLSQLWHVSEEEWKEAHKKE